MEQRIITAFIVVSAALAFFDFVFMKFCVDRKDTTAQFLGFTALCGGAVTLTYMGSVLVRNYFWMSVLSSAYFALIDWMLLGMVAFAFLFTRTKYSRLWKSIRHCLVGWALLETLVFAINPFWEISVSYVSNGDLYAGYSYALKPLYTLHLVFSYGLIVFALLCILQRAFRTPRQYRNQYSYVVLGILADVAVNAVFLYSPFNRVSPHLDYSIFGYSIILMVMYWSCFEYTQKEMQKGLSIEIFENIGQGIVLFDYDNFLVMKNNRAKELLTGVQFPKRMKEADFLNQLRIQPSAGNRNKAYSVQCYLGDQERAVRCDFRPLSDEKGVLLGGLYVFTDSELETDLLTGFQKWKNFRQYSAENPITRKVSVAVFDINELGEINAREGVDEGDRQIRLLSSAMRKCLPAGTWFVRGQDAVLIAVSLDFDADMMQQYAENVKKAYPRSIQYAVSENKEETTNPSVLVEDAMHALMVKKLLDSGSSHSQTLASLVRALQECDSDTEAHVQRTRAMGRKLGSRIGLSDGEQSDLSLLCLLHDIGKIGIPLDILNKPFQLSEDEWTLIRSHVQKGYQIAKSSDMLSFIADMILHHHERWDGKGYPDGLSRDSIPLLSRIISVVDSFDAMTSNRPYHKAIPVWAALEEIRRCAGTQFDPFIAAEFIRMIQESYGGQIPSKEETQEIKRETINFKQAEDEAAAANVYAIQFSQYLLDDANNIIEADANFEKLTGYSRADWEGRNMNQFDLVPPEGVEEYKTLVASYLATSTTVYLEHKLRRKDGGELFVFCYAERIYDHTVKERRTRITITDVSNSYSARLLSLAEIDRSEKRLRYWEQIYCRDSLTGLLNHISFQNDVEKLMQKEHKRILLLMIDVESFKEYNERFGRDAGDQMLKEIARSMKNVTRAIDLCCRMGGDEFAIAFPLEDNVTIEQMHIRVKRVYEEISQALELICPECGIFAGIALSDEAAPDFKELYRRADHALIRAKQSGTNELVWDACAVN